jgi:hypothetical protein
MDIAMLGMRMHCGLAAPYKLSERLVQLSLLNHLKG